MELVKLAFFPYAKLYKCTHTPHTHTHTQRLRENTILASEVLLKIYYIIPSDLISP